jgi:hypothetical protein
MSSAPDQRPAPPSGFREPFRESQPFWESQPFREHLTPSRWVWLALAGLAVSFAVIVLPFGPVPALVTLLVSGALLAGLVRWSTPLVAVRDGELLAGRAHVPVDLLGAAEVLAPDELRQALGPSLDARAYLCIRGWLRRAVRVQLDDPDDPTPYWVISSRRPQELAAALTAARERAPGASG